MQVGGQQRLARSGQQQFPQQREPGPSQARINPPGGGCGRRILGRTHPPSRAQLGERAEPDRRRAAVPPAGPAARPPPGPAQARAAPGPAQCPAEHSITSAYAGSVGQPPAAAPSRTRSPAASSRSSPPGNRNAILSTRSAPPGPVTGAVHDHCPPAGTAHPPAATTGQTGRPRSPAGPGSTVQRRDHGPRSRPGTWAPGIPPRPKRRRPPAVTSSRTGSHKDRPEHGYRSRPAWPRQADPAVGPHTA
jgi:hypothetical protein